MDKSYSRFTGILAMGPQQLIGFKVPSFVVLGSYASAE